MKKLLLLAAGAAMMGFVSCDQLKNLAQINVGAQSQNVDFSVPVVTTSGEQNFGGANVRLNVDSLIKTKNSSVGVNNIKSAKVTSLHVEITDADSVNNFSIVESCKVMLSSDTKPEQVMIGELTGNPDTYASSIDIPLNSIDLAEYLKANTYSYTLIAKTRRGTTKEIHCKATINYDLTVGLE